MSAYNPTLPGKYIPLVLPGGPPKSGIQGRWVVTPWGYLEEIRVIFDNPVPNMDANRPHHFDFSFYEGSQYGGQSMGDTEYHIVQLVRNVG
jgi:hypothetical protein